jgi:UDP-glucose 4-epimerase
MNILITGGAGFIGSNAAHYFVERGHRVTVLDNLLSGYYENISDLADEKKISYYQDDIRNTPVIQKIVSEHEIDTCINYAALISVAESTEKPELTEEINVMGIINLLKVCGENRIKTFIHASSAAVYGDSEVLPKEEDMLPEPKSPYAVSKLAGEYYNRYFAGIHGFTAINCRFFNVFGLRQDPGSQYAAAIPIFIKRALLGSDITIFGDGEQVRDFIFVEDLVSAIDYLRENSTRFPSGSVFNLGYGEYISINELVKKIIAATGSGSKVVYDNPRPGDIKLSYASVEKLLQLGWKKATGFEKGLEKTIEWFRSRV